MAESCNLDEKECKKIIASAILFFMGSFLSGGIALALIAFGMFSWGIWYEPDV
jgi:hypothetical protein